MISSRLRRLGCVTLVLAALPLWAEQEHSSAPHSIQEGTTFLIRLEEKLDAGRLQPGKRFKAKLADNLVGADESRLLRGSRIKGHVSAVGNGLHPRLLLSFDEIETEHGWIPLIATIIAIPGEHGLQVSGEEGDIERQGPSKRHDGGIDSDDSRGPNIAAAAGAVGALFGDRRLELMKGTTLEIRLDRPIQIPWR
jgi:hypothetical protein